MKKFCIIIDCQNDFIDGALGTPEAVDMIPRLTKRINDDNEDTIFVFTADTHYDNYLDTAEGKNLPVKHCIKDTEGWGIHTCLTEHFCYSPFIVEKNTFGTFDLFDWINEMSEGDNNIEIELCGLCTDICVVSNGLLLKTAFPNAKISVNAECCAGTSPEAHEAALMVMKNCQIEVI